MESLYKEKECLEREILNIICWYNEYILNVDPKYFSTAAGEIIKIAKEDYEVNGEIDIVKYRMLANKYNINLDENIYTFKEFENIYRQVKELYYAIKLQEELKLKVLASLTSKNFNYPAALQNLIILVENAEITHTVIKAYDTVINNVIEDLKNPHKDKTGYSTNIPSIDNKLKGLKKHQYIIIAARTNTGKTTFALWLAHKLMKQGAKVLYICHEQEAERLMKKVIGISTKKEFDEISIEDIEDFNKKFKNKIHFIDAKIDIHRLAYEVKLAKLKYGVDVVFVDHIGLLKSHNNKLSRHELISEISKQLKTIAMHEKLLVITLAQINRKIDHTKDKKPTLTMLKDSGALEEDADAILLLHREGIYKDDIDERRMLVRVAKNRDFGLLGDVEIMLKEDFSFYELTEDYAFLKASNYDDIPF